MNTWSNNSGSCKISKIPIKNHSTGKRQICWSLLLKQVYFQEIVVYRSTKKNSKIPVTKFPNVATFNFKHIQITRVCSTHPWFSRHFLQTTRIKKSFTDIATEVQTIIKLIYPKKGLCKINDHVYICLALYYSFIYIFLQSVCNVIGQHVLLTKSVNI